MQGSPKLERNHGEFWSKTHGDFVRFFMLRHSLIKTAMQAKGKYENKILLVTYVKPVNPPTGRLRNLNQLGSLRRFADYHLGCSCKSPVYPAGRWPHPLQGPKRKNNRFWKSVETFIDWLMVGFGSNVFFSES